MISYFLRLLITIIILNLFIPFLVLKTLLLVSLFLFSLFLYVYVFKKQKAVTVILVGACQRSETDMHMGTCVCVQSTVFIQISHNLDLIFVYSGFYNEGTDPLS